MYETTIPIMIMAIIVIYTTSRKGLAKKLFKYKEEMLGKDPKSEVLEVTSILHFKYRKTLVPANCNNQIINRAQKSYSNCQAQPVILNIKNSGTVWERLPSYTTLHRCAGGCGHKRQTTCQPMSEEIIKIPIVTGRCMSKSCSDNCAIIEMMNHTSCRCTHNTQEIISPAQQTSTSNTIYYTITEPSDTRDDISMTTLNKQSDSEDKYTPIDHKCNLAYYLLKSITALSLILFSITMYLVISNKHKPSSMKRNKISHEIQTQTQGSEEYENIQAGLRWKFPTLQWDEYSHKSKDKNQIKPTYGNRSNKIKSTHKVATLDPTVYEEVKSPPRQIFKNNGNSKHHNEMEAPIILYGNNNDHHYELMDHNNDHNYELMDHHNTKPQDSVRIQETSLKTKNLD